MLTEFFKICSRNKDARAYLYKEFPEYYVWNRNGKFWSKKKKGKVIGRVNGANPTEGERYYLRLLLNHVKGPTSFDDLLSVDGNKYFTFKESALKKRLLESDENISECLSETANFQMPQALRRLFAMLFVYCEPSNLRKLWEDYFEPMSEDFKRIHGDSMDAQISGTLKSINFFIESMGKCIKDYDLPSERTNTTGSRYQRSKEIDDELASGTADLIRRAKLIIWDEAPIVKRFAVETLDRSLKDIINCQESFGGKGTRAETVSASLVRSYLWNNIEKLSLATNMRARADPNFSDFLLRVGNGDEPVDNDDMICLPDEVVIKYENDEIFESNLLQSIFPDLERNATSSEYLTTHAILAITNEHVDNLNEKLITMFLGEARAYYSYDEAVDDTHNYYQEEFLNSLMPNGLLPHKLFLKKNCPIMLLRNMEPSNGLCNGTRMVCKSFGNNVIHAEITTCQHAGKQVLLPRIPLSPAENEVNKLKAKMSTDEDQGQQCSMISQLEQSQNKSIIKVRVLRRRSIVTYATRKGDGENWKIILIDDDGTTIQVVIFNDAVEKFRELFMKDWTYFIENSVVKGVNERFLNVHKEIELSLNNNTNSKFYMKLNRQTGRKFKFIIKLKKIDDFIRAKNSYIVEEIEEIPNEESEGSEDNRESKKQKKN
ncbi:hypothetical protein L1049_022097 [Liquidambar formosana]|uniref:ATP-dependent DNA helicase n=1 Tax=Liquidambar formosana TaxID=63359 RepID=A0AAP0RDY0_LIQFO